MGLNKIKALFLVFFLLFIPFSSGIVEVSADGMHVTYPLHKDDGWMNHRKLLFDSMLDYDDAGPNPRHDPRRKPGNGGGGGKP